MADYNLGTASGRIVVDGSAAELGFKVAQNAAGAFFDVVKNRVDQVQSVGKRMAAVGAAGVGGFGVAVKAASGFEKQMSGVQAVANASEEQFDSLRDKALKLGADTAFSASEAAGALEELVKAGVGVEDVLTGAADATVALAAAGGIGLGEAATIAANAMNAFEMSAEEVPKVADILAGVANKGAADVSSLGSSLSQAGAVANLAGLSLRDTAIALGELSDAGINGSDAGTSLKTMLNNLIPTTKDQVSKFEELGLITYDLAEANKVLAKEGLKPAKSMDQVQKSLAKYAEEMGKGSEGSWTNQKAVNALLTETGAMNNQFFDAKGNVKGLAGLQAQLSKAVEGQTRQQKLQNLEILFGADSMRAAAVMAREGRQGVKDYNKALASTSAADVAATRLDNLEGAMEEFGGSMETAMITIGNIFLPMVTKIVKAGTSLINMFNELPMGVQKGIAIFGAVASAGLLLVGAFIALIPVILGFLANMLMLRAIAFILSPLKIFFGLLRGGAGIVASAGGMFARFGLIFSRLWTVLKLIVPGIKLVAFVIGLFSAPVLAAVAAVAALVAAGVILYKKWAPFRDFIDGIVSAIKDKFQQAVAAITPIIQRVLASLKEFGQYVVATLLPVIQKIAQELLGKLVTGWNKVKDAASGLMGPIGQFVSALSGAGDAGSSLGAKILPFLQKIGNLIMTYVVPAIVWIGRMFIENVLPILLKVMGFLGGVVIDTIVTLVQGVIQAVGGIISIFTGLINFFTGLFTGNWSKMWQGVKQIFTGIWNLIVGAIKVYLSVGILKVVGLAVGLLRKIVSGGLRAVLGLFRTILSAVWKFIKFIFSSIVKGIRGYINLHVKIIKGGFNLVRNIITTVLNAVWKFIKGVWNFIQYAFINAIAAITRVVTKAWNWLKDTTTSAFKKFWETIKEFVGRAVQFLKELPGRILDGFKNIGNLLYNIGKDLIQGMINGIKDMAGQAKDAALDVAKSVGGAVGDFFEIGSPSKLAHRYGEWFDQGLEGGLDEDKKRVAKSAIDVAKTAMVGFQATLDPRAMKAMSSGLLAAPSAGAPLPVRPAVKEGGKVINNKITVNNPRPERASQSTSKILRDKVEEAGWR